MPQVVAPSAVLPASRQMEAHVVATSARHVKCTRLLARVVEMKPLFLFSHEMIAPSIAGIVISPVRHRIPTTTTDQAGNTEVPYYCQPRLTI
ncbi:hypothetical protein Krac_2111 [Ktedonobacter racemifer DSM 44963]|uniref:Uncharacterized protein n=1 Tax=Ktedonobacter racemifer DSM 44963 TaxID=485913 RepID=D6U4G4_KTERA|nr:hypothetical protein Krac_2111 [Ktedonobacter racemifer DSM 44963]